MQAVADATAGADEALRLADLFCRGARRSIRDLFRDLWSNDDALAYRIGQRRPELHVLGLGPSAEYGFRIDHPDWPSPLRATSGSAIVV